MRDAVLSELNVFNGVCLWACKKNVYVYHVYHVLFVQVDTLFKLNGFLLIEDVQHLKNYLY